MYGLVLLTLVGMASAFSSGNVGLACSSMSPLHFLVFRQETSPPFQVVAEYYRDGYYLVRILGGGNPFKGFLVQARDPEDNLVGTFVDVQNGQILDCTDTGGAISHNNAKEKYEVTALWHPKDYYGPIRFRGTVVKDYNNYWTDINSNILEI